MDEDFSMTPLCWGCMYRTLKLNTLHASHRFVLGKSSKIRNCFLAIYEAISRTTAPILGLFVLIWMHFSCWSEKRQWKFEFWSFLGKKFEKFELTSVCSRCIEKDKIRQCLVGWWSWDWQNMWSINDLTCDFVVDRLYSELGRCHRQWKSERCIWEVIRVCNLISNYWHCSFSYLEQIFCEGITFVWS